MVWYGGVVETQVGTSAWHGGVTKPRMKQYFIFIWRFNGWLKRHFWGRQPLKRQRKCFFWSILGFPTPPYIQSAGYYWLLSWRIAAQVHRVEKPQSIEKRNFITNIRTNFEGTAHPQLKLLLHRYIRCLFGPTLTMECLVLITLMPSLGTPLSQRQIKYQWICRTHDTH